MARYFVIRQETGVRIDEVESYRDARVLISELEEEDKERNVYKPNSYSIEIV